MLQMIINIILTLSLPITIWLGYWIAQYQIQRMPGPQRSALEQFARMAAQHVEQNHQDSIDKKALVKAFANDLFGAFRLPAPPETALDIAIGSAMHEASSSSVQSRQDG